jgi:protein-L-isoaspartate(D-aspartate) O-methyltransferase
MTDFAALRTAMVDCQVRPSDVTKFPIIDAMLKVRREVFVPAARRDVAYAGAHVPLGGGRVVMDPRVLAKMLDALDITPDELVLEIGAGLGYATAVIARMAEAVIAVEEDADLARDAEANLSEESVDNAVVVTGALTAGAAKHGPYDAMIFGGAVEVLPESLVAQVKDGGRIGAIVVEGGVGRAKIGIVRAGHVAWHSVFDAEAPVLPGFSKEVAFAL